MGIDPFAGRFVIPFPRGSDTLRIDIAVCILPSLLKNQAHFRSIGPRDILNAAETGHFHTFAAIRTLVELIVIDYAMRTLRERDSHHQF